MQPWSLKNALLAEIHEQGVLNLQRKLHRLHTQAPHRTYRELLEEHLDPNLASKGEKQAAICQEQGIHPICLFDPEYPKMLVQIPDPPVILFTRGDPRILHRPCISIVGSRMTTSYGRQITKQLAGELAKTGFTIVSGLALGVDACGHTAALETGGRTAGVLGSGVDQIYPREHHNLANQMIESGGLILSEMEPGAPPKPFHFPIRNRIISGLSHATLVVEAKEKSGSLITARHCLDQGRELFAVPGPIHQQTSRGTNGLIQSGEARLVLSTADIVAELRPLLGMAADHGQVIRSGIKDPVTRLIYDQLDAFEPVPLDLIISQSGVDTGTVMAKLVDLESQNLVERLPGQRFLRNPLVEAV